VKAATPAGVVSASLLGAAPTTASVLARSVRRDVRYELGELLRSRMPKVTQVRKAAVPTNIRTLARKLVKRPGQATPVRLSSARVEKRVRTIALPAAGPVRASGRGRAVAAIERTNLQYYFASERNGGPVRDIRMVSIQADPQGNVLRSQVLVSS
jgi:hypothetical protein